MTITTQTKAAKAAGVHVITVKRMLRDNRIKPYRVKGVKTDQVCVEEVIQAVNKVVTPETKIKEIKQILDK